MVAGSTAGLDGSRGSGVVSFGRGGAGSATAIAAVPGLELLKTVATSARCGSSRVKIGVLV